MSAFTEQTDAIAGWRRRTALAATLFAVGVLTMLVLAPSSPAAATKACGNNGSAAKIKAKRTNCKTARRVAKTYQADPMPGKTVKVGKWRCYFNPKSVEPPFYKVSCKKGKSRIWWLQGFVG